MVQRGRSDAPITRPSRDPMHYPGNRCNAPGMKSPRRKLLIAAVAVLTFLGVGPPMLAANAKTIEPAAAGRPNIVFVLTDDLSWNLVAHMPACRRCKTKG